MSINKAIITGNLGGDPELRYTNSGKAVMTLNVAVNDRVPDGRSGSTTGKPARTWGSWPTRSTL